MPYILSPFIREKSAGMWAEWSAYEKKSIYKIEGDKLPPVNYDEHVLRSHSLTHVETPAHTQENGPRLEHYLEKYSYYFYGKVVVIKLEGDNYQKLDKVHHWVIKREEIETRLKALKVDLAKVSKIFITTEMTRLNSDDYHDPDFVLTLSQEAADYLVALPSFHLYGTSWKSSDYNPGKPERPIHNTLFRKGLIFENLKLDHVPEGSYFLSAFPVPLAGASEAPVVPVLFDFSELPAFA